MAAPPSNATQVMANYTFAIEYANSSVDLFYQTAITNPGSATINVAIYLVIDGVVLDSYTTQFLAGFTRRDTSFKTILGLATGNHTAAIFVVSSGNCSSPSAAVQGIVRGA